MADPLSGTATLRKFLGQTSPEPGGDALADDALGLARSLPMPSLNGVAPLPVDVGHPTPEDQAPETLDVVIREAPSADEARWAGVVELLLAVEVPGDAA
jgi:hypothetical protein